MITAGIIGFGYMGNFHLKKVMQIESIRVTAVFDIDCDKLVNAREAGLAAYDNLEDFLNTDIDLVIICTPNQWHANYAIAALKSGKHVLCEKPATMTIKELNEVIKCAEKENRIFTVHQNRRWDTDYKVIRKVVEDQQIGRVTTIESRVFGERGVCYGWRADPQSGGGMLYDWGVHLIDQMLQLFQGEKVESVRARLLSILTPAVDDYFELEMLFSNQVCAKIMVGTFALQKLPRWFVFGDRGTLKLDDFTGKNGGMARIKGEVKGFESVIGKKDLGPSRTMAPLNKEQLEELSLPEVEEESLAFWINLIETIEGKAEINVKMNEVLRQMKVVEAAFLSSEKNEIIKTAI